MSGEDEEEVIPDTLEDAGALEADVGATLLGYILYLSTYLPLLPSPILYLCS